MAFTSQHLNAKQKVNTIDSTKPYEKGMLALISESVFIIGLLDASGISALTICHRSAYIFCGSFQPQREAM
jgi:Mn2+/Fe2+ NRAMP family transporter